MSLPIKTLRDRLLLLSYFDHMAAGCRDNDPKTVEEARDYLACLTLQGNHMTMATIFRTLSRVLDEQQEMIDQGGFQPKEMR